MHYRLVLWDFALFASMTFLAIATLRLAVLSLDQIISLGWIFISGDSFFLLESVRPHFLTGHGLIPMVLWFHHLDYLLVRLIGLVFQVVVDFIRKMLLNARQLIRIRGHDRRTIEFEPLVLVFQIGRSGTPTIIDIVVITDTTFGEVGLLHIFIVDDEEDI